MQLNTVVFSIDDGHVLRTRKKFLKWIDGLVAVGKVSYCSPCIGYWDGKLETSYMVREHDFNLYIKESIWVEKQVCFLYVPGDVRQPCTLRYSNGSLDSLDTMKRIDPEELHHHSGWTYVEATETYYTC